MLITLNGVRLLIMTDEIDGFDLSDVDSEGTRGLHLTPGERIPVVEGGGPYGSCKACGGIHGNVPYSCQNILFLAKCLLTLGTLLSQDEMKHLKKLAE